ncbi:hypothetical protein SAMN04488693_10727 [Arthrobacter subterraneus]|uniref:Uncharacterized protein n=1 Tax=Arthrobacter subterraneus TaxID=335973 RepID=A0A1G8IJ07_9MICC|nr:hypothetical protein [Arthrobacter subterraneus]SDI18520.1 hypothetical protein SAMN04488693_10727 [Arthrobacter subterraneus]
MEYLTVLLPSIAMGVIFYFVMKAIFNADRAEREAESAQRNARENAFKPESSPGDESEKQ